MLIVENNTDIVTLTADKVNNLKTLTITENRQLERINFEALNANSFATVTIGGMDQANNKQAVFHLILQEGNDDATDLTMMLVPQTIMEPKSVPPISSNNGSNDFPTTFNLTNASGTSKIKQDIPI